MSAAGRGTKRRENDHYATPAWVTRAVLSALPNRGLAIDAGCGTGAIMREMIRNDLWADVIGVDNVGEYVQRASARHLRVELRDFLDPAWHPCPSLVIMNPPFSLAMEFVERALELVRESNGTVAALLRLNWLASRARAAFHEEHPADILVLPKRPSFTDDGRTDATEYAWFVWGPGRGGRWEIADLSFGKAPV